MIYPSCPKSLVNSSNFFKSAALTVGLDVANDRNMSVLEKKSNEENISVLMLVQYFRGKIVFTNKVS